MDQDKINKALQRKVALHKEYSQKYREHLEAYMDWKDHSTEPPDEFEFVKKIKSLNDFADYVTSMEPSPYQDIIEQREEMIYSDLNVLEREAVEELYIEELLKETEEEYEDIKKKWRIGGVPGRTVLVLCM